MKVYDEMPMSNHNSKLIFFLSHFNTWLYEIGLSVYHFKSVYA